MQIVSIVIVCLAVVLTWNNPAQAAPHSAVELEPRHPPMGAMGGGPMGGGISPMGGGAGGGMGSGFRGGSGFGGGLGGGSGLGGGFGGGGGGGGGGSDSGGGSHKPCSRYTIISTRGTSEMQGPSMGFRNMNSRILSSLPGGALYNTMYPADWSQQSESGTRDIVRKVQTTLANDPNHCFFLQGYSQGAAATVNAMSRLQGQAGDSVKGVFLIGNPCRRAGLACNVDGNGGGTTRMTNGMERAMCGIPQNWVSKTTDVCIQSDGVCSGGGITPAHMMYGQSPAVQSMGLQFAMKMLKAAVEASS